MKNPKSDKPLVAVIAEDDKELSHLFSEALRRAGFKTEIVGRGDLVIGRLRDLQPSLVILDLNLPHLSGQDILAQIRKDEDLCHLRVIVVSANHRLAEQLRDEADLVLVKPVGFKQLRDLASRLGAHLSSQ